MDSLWVAVPTTILFAVLGISAVPIRFRFSAAMTDLGEPLRSDARVRWAFGLVDVALRKGTEKAHPKRVASRRAEKLNKRLRFRRLLTNASFWVRLGILLKRLFGAIRWEAIRFHARVGLGDPADTGRLWGLLNPLLAGMMSHSVRIDPDFDGPVFAFQSEGEIRFIPLKVGWILLTFAAAPETWRVLRPALRK